MPTVNSMIQHLLPRGSNPGRPGVWAELPLWPPDVFAVCATLVDRSGCYASPRYANGYPDGADGCFFSGADYYDDINYYDDIDDLAQDWRANRLDRLQQYWSVLMDPAHGEVADHDHPTAQTWQDTAIVLMMVADKVCVAMGFAPRPDLEEEKKRRRMFADHYFEQYVRMLDGQASESSTSRTASAGWCRPARSACSRRPPPRRPVARFGHCRTTSPSCRTGARSKRLGGSPASPTPKS